MSCAVRAGMIVLGVAAAAAFAVAHGCGSDPSKGYVFSSSHEAAIRTVSVPIFANPTYTHGIEVELTDAIIKEIQANTPWKVTRGDANATLVGTLSVSELDRLSLNRDTGYVQEMAVKLTVDFEFTDNRTGKVLVTRKNFTASDFFVPALPVGERVEAGQHGAVQRMAQDIVAELRSSW